MKKLFRKWLLSLQLRQTNKEITAIETQQAALSRELDRLLRKNASVRAEIGWMETKRNSHVITA